MKYFLFTTLVAASLSSFAGGRPDETAIAQVKGELQEDGYTCEEVYPEDFSLRNIPDGGSYTIKYKCEKEDSKSKIFEIKYLVNGDPRAKCRSRVATLINEIVSKK